MRCGVLGLACFFAGPPGRLFTIVPRNLLARLPSIGQDLRNTQSDCPCSTRCNLLKAEAGGTGDAPGMDTQEPENVIFAYTDAEALDDGVLVAIRCGSVNRVARAVFDHFTTSMGSSPVTGPVTDVTRLMRAIESMLKLEADTDGWRTGSYDGKTLWLTPNEVGGLTLMFPEDW